MDSGTLGSAGSEMSSLALALGENRVVLCYSPLKGHSRIVPFLLFP